MIAIGSGAKVIEKHFTLNKKLNGPDHRSSLNPKELIQMIKLIRIFEKKFGQIPKSNFKFRSTKLIANQEVDSCKKAYIKGEKFSNKI